MTMEVLADWVSRISNVVWNGLLLYLLVGTGIVFTIRTRFIQVRKFGAGWKHLFGHFSLNGEKAGKDGMSPFQALTTAIAAQVGTGNIAGAATALYWRPGRDFLDVAECILRHVHHLRRGGSRAEV